MDLQQQLNQEFNRIFDLASNVIEQQQMEKIILETASVYFRSDPFTYSISTKREILAAIFLAKNGDEYVLAEGSLENPKLWSATIANEEQINIGKYPFVAMVKQQVEAENQPKNLRDLFLQNCFGQTEQNINNLKLINW